VAMKTINQRKNLPPFTQIAYLLGVVGIVVMQYLYWTHRTIAADAGWVKYALYMTIFAITGLLGTQMINNQPLIPMEPKHFAPISLDTGVRAAIILAASMVTQLIVKAALSFTIQEQAAYFIFAAVCEELFFRVLIISILLKLKDDFQMKFIAVVVQALMFAAIHQNYYSNLPMLVSVFIGGIILGIFFVWWRDPTANILAHFALNVIAVQNLLVMF
jgi:membrane protease YdiL (CAAX protease family)